MHRKIKAIIVDDEPRLRHGVEKIVCSMGEDWEVVGGYSSAIECLEACQTQKITFDLLITDVKMPGMDGLTLINKLKELNDFHSVVISGYDDFQFLQTAIREGASDYLIKPIDRDEFRNQLNEIKKEIVTKWKSHKVMRSMELKASQLTYVKQVQKLSELFWQHDMDLSLMEWTKDFPVGHYRLMYFSIDNLSKKRKTFQKEDWSVWQFSLDNIYNEMENQLQLKSWRWAGENLSYWMLLYIKEDKGVESFDNQCLDFANEVISNTKKFSPFTCSAAVSRKVEDLTTLSSLKNELSTYIQFRLIYGGNQVFSNESVNKWNINQKEEITDNKIESQIKKIIFSLDNKSEHGIKSKINDFLNCIESLDSPKDIEHSLHLFGIKVINYLINHTQVKDGISLLEEISVITTTTTNLHELRNKVYEWMKKVLNILKQNKEELTHDPIEVAKQWILSHLDSNLTIQKIADYVYMNPTYFCKYFKNQTGETVLDYVTTVRLEKARSLLLQKNLKIYDVSEMVGYTDSKYFSKLFKKYYGETPSQYKEEKIISHKRMLDNSTTELTIEQEK